MFNKAIRRLVNVVAVLVLVGGVGTARAAEAIANTATRATPTPVARLHALLTAEEPIPSRLESVDSSDRLHDPSLGTGGGSGGHSSGGGLTDELVGAGAVIFVIVVLVAFVRSRRPRS